MANFPKQKDLEEVRKKLESGPASRPLPKNASSLERAKYRLCEKFVIYMNSNKLSQRELAERVEIDEALISKIVHYNFDEFTTDRLIKYLSVIYPNVNLFVEVA